MKRTLTRANGLPDSETIRQFLNDNSMTKVPAIVRKLLSIAHSKLELLVHACFSTASASFKANDACLWCLGIFQSKVKNATKKYRIRFDYAVSSTKITLQANPTSFFYF